MMAWPNKWRHSTSRDKHNRFLSVIRCVTSANKALIVAKGLTQWPDSNDRLGGFIDIWWIVHDGGLLILLAYVLSQHRTWKSCRLRVFTVAQLEDNSVQMKKDLEKFLYHLRIEAQVEVIEMSDSGISSSSSSSKQSINRVLLQMCRRILTSEQYLWNKELKSCKPFPETNCNPFPPIIQISNPMNSMSDECKQTLSLD